MSKIGVVVTTIGKGEFLEGYCNAAEKAGLRETVTFYIVDDRKTPRELYSEVAKWYKKGFKIEIGESVAISRLPFFKLIPFNSDNRRNVGYLRAIEEGCDKIISLDDDNFYHSEDFFTSHSVVGGKINEYVIENGWYNICELVGIPNHPRGWPPNLKGISGYGAEKEMTIAVNAGLWMEHPDVDAYSWLSDSRMRSRGFWGSVVLGKGAWSPVNSQNTAVSRRAMAAYYFIPMGATVQGMQIDRYGDIFQGYFLQACTKAMDEGVRFGTPLVRHTRNSHNYLNDARLELGCVYMLEELCNWLTEVKLSNKSYVDSYLHLADALEEAVEDFKGWIWTIDAKAYFHRVSYLMRRWVEAYCFVGGES